MRVWLNKYFGFSKSEFNGLLLLVLIIAALKAVPFFYGFIKVEENDSEALLSQLAKIEITDNELRVHKAKRFAPTFNKKSKLFKFDPNQLNADRWQMLGLSPKQAQAVINYVSKGGKFRKAEDLRKMYTISPDLYQKLLPFVVIDPRYSSNPRNDFTYVKKEVAKKPAVIIDVNHADSAELEEIKGIGPALARRISRYRDRLGGFYRKEQLLDVYGLDSNRYNEIKDQVKLGPAVYKTVNLNTAQFEDMKRIPYLTLKQMNAIIQYRKQHGNYVTAADLKKIVILNQELIDRISPYLSF
ncbi:ComEA family DNA-binding protein [Pedobacter frigidisoli]|uniref:ComEA family DNA-binding protein n=1 Tax=Pedobacter frigidisoli TaxID=2530455 RepID=UPI00292F9BEB|nr:helix-hairpin-helix domain-containing protein [Pedobacter frigidisoli]